MGLTSAGGPFFHKLKKHCFKNEWILHALLEPPRLFDFGNFSYLHVIRTPRLLDTSE